LSTGNQTGNLKSSDPATCERFATAECQADGGMSSKAAPRGLEHPTAAGGAGRPLRRIPESGHLESCDRSCDIPGSKKEGPPGAPESPIHRCRKPFRFIPQLPGTRRPYQKKAGRRKASPLPPHATPSSRPAYPGCNPAALCGPKILAGPGGCGQGSWVPRAAPASGETGPPGAPAPQ